VPATPGLGDDTVAATLGTHEERHRCFRVAGVVEERKSVRVRTAFVSLPTRRQKRPMAPAAISRRLRHGDSSDSEQVVIIFTARGDT
jgi:hypothetical protein